MPKADAGTEKGPAIINDMNHTMDSASAVERDESIVDTHAQPGVQDIEAVTVAWTTSALIFAYTLTHLLC